MKTKRKTTKEKPINNKKKDIGKETKGKVKVEISDYFKEKHNKHDILLKNIKNNLPELEELLKKITDHWQYEDLIYRFYHHSFKVYWIQGETEGIVKALRKISPHEKDSEPFNSNFENIFAEGTCQNKEWTSDHNLVWDVVTRPKLEAFFHAKFMLEMAVKYGKKLEEAPNCLPSGWAALLYLYNLR